LGIVPERADKLRRAMATFRRSGTIPKFREEFIAGMMAKKYDRDFAERCFQQIEGFADYGFPESHSASFAILVYVSAWMKCHYPAAFAAALLNSQPMGFYAPAQIVRDAREHNVEVRPVDVNHSDWDCTLEPAVNGAPALRLGLRQIKGFREAEAKALVEKRGAGYATLREAWQRAGLTTAALEALANADACGSLGLDRRAALWQVRALGETPLPLFSHAEGAHAEAALPIASSAIGHNSRPTELIQEPPVVLPAMPLGEQVVEDYRHLTFTLKKHPMALLRHRFVRDGTVQHVQLPVLANGEDVTITGLVLVRQQPGTSKGVIFLTMEDETGIANVIVWQRVYQRFRRTLLDARLLQVRGRLQREGLVIHIVAETLLDRTDELRLLSQEDGRFEHAMARADQVRRPGHDVRDVMPAGRNFK
jgi:error-prone DNA polymerase